MQVIWMGWAYEHLPSTIHTRVWQRKFLVLKKTHFQLFSVAPVGRPVISSIEFSEFYCFLLYPACVGECCRVGETGKQLQTSGNDSEST